ncbi:hypothetical protein MHYP_G00359210 [Metynnis hypsauchen]
MRADCSVTGVSLDLMFVHLRKKEISSLVRSPAPDKAVTLFGSGALIMPVIRRRSGERKTFLCIFSGLISAGRKLARPFTSRVKKEVRSSSPTESRMLGCDGSLSLAAHADEASSSYIFTPRLPHTKLESGSRIACQR